jgi:predicted helicase
MRQMAHHALDLKAELGGDPHADSIAQSAICAAPILAATLPNVVTALNWLHPQLEPWEQAALKQAHSSPPLPLSLSPSPAHLYDTFLHHYSRTSRKHRGVFFTPQPIADYIVAQTDRLLRDQCGFPDGLADDRVTIIDPACGTGVFLLAAINFLRRKSNDNRCLESLISRLIGIEILPPASLLAKLNIALTLAEMGYDFRNFEQINILTADALSPDTQSKIQNPKTKTFPVLLGNPPFSSLSTTINPWITRLVRGDDEIRGYVRANGQQLGERKTWLHDDYVKFIRLSQWHIEEAGCGLVGFVTNHGYLDNTTFRLMRHELLRVFPHIEILDLHGNRKKHETSPTPTRSASEGPNGLHSRDENIFSLDQGIAISFLCRPPTLARSASEGKTSSSIGYAELWGSRKQKLDALAAGTEAPRQDCLPSPALQAGVLNPQPPNWPFIPAEPASICSHYTSAWSLVDAMPVTTTAPVTARDHFVVTFTREELIARINEFRDLAIPDDEIRQRYFHRTRSARYQTGDTRSWKLNQARCIIATDDNWPEKIIRCLYRPFDWRYIFWHPAMIDWPRTKVTRHLVANGQALSTNQIPNPQSPIPNLCLIARRQQLPTQPCTFFWISDCLALDGVIRSDNRGSESLFPLYVDGQANFAPTFVDQFAAATQLTWHPLGRGDLTTTFGPEDLLAYIYALFHLPTYREKHVEALRTAFPRVLPPENAPQFATLARCGCQLIDLHLLRIPTSIPEYRPPSPRPLVSSFRAGGYIALKKWLQPKHRSADDAVYARIVAAIARTLEIMHEIDAICP